MAPSSCNIMSLGVSIGGGIIELKNGDAIFDPVFYEFFGCGRLLW